MLTISKLVVDLLFAMMFCTKSKKCIKVLTLKYSMISFYTILQWSCTDALLHRCQTWVLSHLRY